MASRFATVSKDEILAVNEAAALINTKKLRQKLSFRRLLVGRKKIHTEFATNHKNDPQNTVICNVNKLDCKINVASADI